ncbi:uncharacterized protein [Solanum tuberosum]|uniref:uncharacterized protein n=1 Tax=Solanum tuberosum TaxID=4113 RepID=UPI0003D25CB7|nr:PREDICTED: uncharacterized protein LOC102598604 [Solanum tuberosum]
MTDVTIVEKILRSLTPKYDYVICSIEESKDKDELLLEELQSSLLVHEQKMNRSSSSEEQALKASTNTHFSNFRGMGKGRGRERGRGRGDRGFRDEGSKDGSRNFRANDDHGKGRGRNLTNQKLPNDKDEKSNFAESNEVETFFGDFSTVTSIGKGDIKIRTKNGFEETISNVLYVPTLKSNLLSVGQLQEKGYAITIEKGAYEIYNLTRGAIAVVKISSNRLFPLKIENIHRCLKAEVRDPLWLWHFRYGHLVLAD